MWRVEAAGCPVALRRHVPGHASVRAHVAAELAWLDALAAPGGRSTPPAPPLAPTPLRRVDGVLAPVGEVGPDDTPVAWWTALAWVDGTTLGRLPDLREARATGAMVARPRPGVAPPPDFGRPAYDVALFARAAAALFAAVGSRVDARARRTIARALPRAQATLAGLWASGADVGVIHADLHDGNVIWAPGIVAPVAIDFGRRGLAPLALDVAMAQHYVTPELGDALLAGYVAEGGAPPFDVAALPALRFLAGIDNVATLAQHAAEREAVIAEVPLLADQARHLTP